MSVEIRASGPMRRKCESCDCYDDVLVLVVSDGERSAFSTSVILCPTCRGELLAALAGTEVPRLAGLHDRTAGLIDRTNAELVELRKRLADVEESASMACENPCGDCAGCLLAAKVYAEPEKV